MNNMKQTQDDRTIHRSQFTKSASWIIGGSQVKHSAFKLLSQFCRSFDLFTGTCWVRKAHTAHLPKSAFTLAETLIVIGIIGVVAALTLPNLNHATGDKETVTRVMKVYSTLTDAIDRAQANYGEIEEWNNIFYAGAPHWEISQKFADRILEFLKTQKVCSCGDKSGNCEEFYSSQVGAVLADGTSIGITCNQVQCGIAVDINGPNKGKNERGTDIFFFTTRQKINFLLPDFGYPELYKGKYCTYTDCYDSGECTNVCGYYTAWVIQNGNLDYLKCPDELNWETQTSCK